MSKILEKKIREAFSGVVLGGGIGLYEAESLDCMADQNVRDKARERDEKIDWSQVSSGDFINCFSAYYWLDPEGLRFYLPAMMICEINDERLFFGLEISKNFGTERYSILTSFQRSVVRDFLFWCVENKRNGHEEISDSLRFGYWKN